MKKRISDLEKRSGIIFGAPFDSHGRICRNARKNVPASYSALLLILAAELVETRGKTNFAGRNSFFSRVSGREKRCGIIFGAPFDSRGRVGRDARKNEFRGPKFVFSRVSDLEKRSGIIPGSSNMCKIIAVLSKLRFLTQRRVFSPAGSFQCLDTLASIKIG